MWNLYDIAYAAGLAIAAPVWLLKPSARRKVKAAFAQRMGEVAPRAGDDPAILIHAVSVGEMNATRTLIQSLRAMRPGLRFIVSVTTDTGFTRGQELYGPADDVTVIRYPLDFSSAINRVLNAIRPEVVVLMELEVWPNFIKRCTDRGIPVMVANARLTPSSYRNYRLGDLFLRPTFNRLAIICAQDMTYAERFLKLGVAPHRVVVTGTMKFDNASLAPPSALAAENARKLGLNTREEIIWVCGSTGPGEEEIILRVYRRLLARFARMRLVIVPRHPPRFDEVSQIIAANRFQCLRYNGGGREYVDFSAVIPPVVLVDAMGVLRDFYSIAHLVFVGRTLVDLGPRQHGSDMIEPAALGRPVIVGPFTANFAEAMRKFKEADAMLEVRSEAELEQAAAVLLSTPAEAAAMGRRAAETVVRERGATARHAAIILQILAAKRGEPIETRPVNPGVAAPAHPAAASGSVVITRLGPVPPR